jgi:hypothetical protein
MRDAFRRGERGPKSARVTIFATAQKARAPAAYYDLSSEILIPGLGLRVFLAGSISGTLRVYDTSSTRSYEHPKTYYGLAVT